MIQLFCGSYDFIPLELKLRNITVIGQHTETGAEMSRRGQEFYVKHKDESPMIFTNNGDFFNGFRVGVMKTHAKDKTEPQVRIVYINPQGQSTDIKIDPDGNIDRWPEGFFDQAEKDLIQLLGWGSDQK